MQVMETQLLSLRGMAEAWVRDPVQAACDLELLVGSALALWRVFHKTCLQRRPGEDGDEAEAANARRNRQVVSQFGQVFDLIASADERLRADGQQVQGLADLAGVRAEVAELLAVPLDEVIRGHVQARSGTYRSAEDVRRDLQRRLHAGS